MSVVMPSGDWVDTNPLVYIKYKYIVYDRLKNWEHELLITLEILVKVTCFNYDVTICYKELFIQEYRNKERDKEKQLNLESKEWTFLLWETDRNMQVYVYIKWIRPLSEIPVGLKIQSKKSKHNIVCI